MLNIAANHILRYPKGTIDNGIKYEVNQNINLEGYVDSDLVGSAIDRKSTSGCCFSMRSGVISWFSRKQSCIALSTAEAEYIVACLAVMRQYGSGSYYLSYFYLPLDATCIFCDN